MVLLGDVVILLVSFEIVLIMAQDRCMVCAEYTMGMEIILGTPDRTRT
jgi:hypothetical protein